MHLLYYLDDYPAFALDKNQKLAEFDNINDLILFYKRDIKDYGGKAFAIDSINDTFIRLDNRCLEKFKKSKQYCLAKTGKCNIHIGRHISV